MSKKRRRERSDADRFFGSGAKKSGRSERHRRKDAQLCAQARDAVAMVLAESTDPVFHGVWVVAAEPSPSIAHLRVVVAIPEDADADHVLARLGAMAGVFRSEVTETINRKKAPMLSFVLVPLESVQ